VLEDPDDGYYVYVVKAGKLKMQSVQLGLESDLELEIVDGLAEGDRIAAHPDTTFREGMRVGD
jgi:HlyD family secretion protein